MGVQWTVWASLCPQLPPRPLSCWLRTHMTSPFLQIQDPGMYSFLKCKLGFFKTVCFLKLKRESLFQEARGTLRSCAARTL